MTGSWNWSMSDLTHNNDSGNVLTFLSSKSQLPSTGCAVCSRDPAVYKVVSRDFRGTHTIFCVGPQAGPSPSSQSERRFVSRTWFTPPFLQSPPWFTRPYFQSTEGPTQKSRPVVLGLQNRFNHWYKKCISSLCTQDLIPFNTGSWPLFWVHILRIYNII